MTVANTLADIPFSAVRILIYDIIVYFMCNLARSGGGFWTFHLFNNLAYIAMQGFFRTFGEFVLSFVDPQRMFMPSTDF